MLNSKKLSLDDYLIMLEQDGTPFDEIAIMGFARMYHCHIGILMAGRYWCTKIRIIAGVKFSFFGMDAWIFVILNRKA